MDNRRLKLENDNLNRKFPRRFVFRDIDTAHPWLDCSIKSDIGKNYNLKITLNDYPSKMPEVFILFPFPILDHEGNRLDDLKSSYKLHLLEPDESGHIQICHYKKSEWDASYPLTHVLLHAKMWIEALEEHQRTGTDLDFYLKH